MEELSYKDLQIKAKELGMEKVVGISAEELKKYIVEHQPNDNATNIEGQTSVLLTGESSVSVINSNNEDKSNDGESFDASVSDESENNLNGVFIDREVEQIVVKTSELKTTLNFSQDKDSLVQKRGFRDCTHVKSYINSEDFKKLSIPDQEELKAWFESI